jgi:hypothetical protein
MHGMEKSKICTCDMHEGIAMDLSFNLGSTGEKLLHQAAG